jgi:signal transduction histidine kinase
VFGAVIAGFVASATLAQLQARSIGTLSESLSGDAMPSISHLSGARAQLHRLETMATDLVAVEPEARAAVLARLVEVKHAMNVEVDAYIRLPVFPGESELWGNVRDALDAENTAVGELRAAVEGGDRARVRAALGAVHEATEKADAAFVKDVEFNATTSAAMARQIGEMRERSLRLSIVLHVASVLLSVLLAVMLVRVVARASQALRENADAHLRRAEELEQFAGRVAHDLRNPLNAVALWLSRVGTLAPEGPIAAAAGRALTSLRRSDRIIDALLAYARAGARPAAGSRADVRHVMAEVVDEFHPQARETKAELSCATVPDCEVACDEGILLAVLSNLVKNALKFLDDDGRRQVALTVVARSKDVRFEVRDTGVGVPESMRELIFEPFVRGSDARQPGIGLGLATVKRVCDTHGGRVGVEAQADGGSCFWIELPRAPDGERVAVREPATMPARPA